MVSKMTSRMFAIVFIFGFGTSQACNFEDIMECLDIISDLDFNEIQDACDTVTSAEQCLQTLYDSGSCSAEINSAIEDNKGTIEKVGKVCNTITGNEGIECTINGVLKCLEPSESAADSNVELVCSIIGFVEPCLEHIEDACSNKRFVKAAVKAAATLIKGTDALC